MGGARVCNHLDSRSFISAYALQWIWTWLWESSIRKKTAARRLSQRHRNDCELLFADLVGVGPYVHFAIRKRTFIGAAVNVCFGSIPVIRLACTPVAGIGHKQPFAETETNVCFPIRKETFELLAAAQSNLFDG